MFHAAYIRALLFRKLGDLPQELGQPVCGQASLSFLLCSSPFPHDLVVGLDVLGGGEVATVERVTQDLSLQ